MIRFINIGDQITQESNDFAFYDTVTDEFLELQTGPVFSDRSDFEEAANTCSCKVCEETFSRCRTLIPPAIQ
jgi:hypothetical protein